MVYGLLEELKALLEADGIPAGEEYPAGERVEILSPVAAVGLRELDCANAVARFSVRILSPRILGGWCCQVWAARAVEALHGAGMTTSVGEMEYLSGSDCFGILVDAAQSVVIGPEGWMPGSSLKVFCGEWEQVGVQSFTAVRDQGRRILGTTGYGRAVGVTQGREGWELELIQQVDRAPDPTEEPFVLTVRDGDRVCRYTGCCWNEERYEHTDRGLRLIRRGFALGREEADE